MRFAVRLLGRRGRPLRRHDVVSQAPLVGDLRVEQIRDSALRRYIRTARLFREMEILHRDERPTLYDAHIVAMSPPAFTLAGFERVEKVQCAQSWLCRE